jgi:RHS repeat-associated protein
MSLPLSITISPLPIKSTNFSGEPENGLNYVRARYYSARHGRFVTKDPITGKDGDSQSLNRYIYALNNPVRLIDVSGLSPLDATSQTSIYATSDLLHAGLVDSEHHAISKERLQTILQLQQDALYYQVLAINYEAEANIWQGVYDALQTTKSLVTFDGIGVAAGLSHQVSTLLGISGYNNASKITGAIGTVGDVVGAVSGFAEAIKAADKIGSALTSKGQNLFKASGVKALFLDAGNPIAETYYNLISPTWDFIFSP